jgi:hypothetical protein
MVARGLAAVTLVIFEEDPGWEKSKHIVEMENL